MDFSQLLNFQSLPALVIFCVGAIIVLVVLGFVLNLLGTAIGAIGGIFQIFTDLLAGGPVVWCGCLALIAAIVVCGGGILLVSSALSACGTPAATNLCTLFGR